MLYHELSPSTYPAEVCNFRPRHLGCLLYALLALRSNYRSGVGFVKTDSDEFCVRHCVTLHTYQRSLKGSSLISLTKSIKWPRTSMRSDEEKAQLCRDADAIISSDIS